MTQYDPKWFETQSWEHHRFHITGNSVILSTTIHPYYVVYNTVNAFTIGFLFFNKRKSGKCLHMFGKCWCDFRTLFYHIFSISDANGKKYQKKIYVFELYNKLKIN